MFVHFMLVFLKNVPACKLCSVHCIASSTKHIVCASFGGSVGQHITHKLYKNFINLFGRGRIWDKKWSVRFGVGVISVWMQEFVWKGCIDILRIGSKLTAVRNTAIKRECIAVGKATMVDASVSWDNCCLRSQPRQRCTLKYYCHVNLVFTFYHCLLIYFFITLMYFIYRLVMLCRNTRWKTELEFVFVLCCKLKCNKCGTGIW